MTERAIKAMGESGNRGEVIFPLPTWTACVKVIRKWAKRSGVEKRITWHTARHTLGYILKKEKGVETSALQAIYNHKDINLTARYGNIVTDEKLKVLKKMV